MTTTDEPTDLESMTSAQLLELCLARGLRATGWPKARRLEALLSGESAPAAPAGGNRLAAQLLDRARQRQPDESLAAARRAAELASRTGACGATGCGCEGWLPSERDAFSWEVCADVTCWHTRWSHAIVEQGREGEPEPAATGGE